MRRQDSATVSAQIALHLLHDEGRFARLPSYHTVHPSRRNEGRWTAGEGIVAPVAYVRPRRLPSSVIPTLLRHVTNA